MSKYYSEHDIEQANLVILISSASINYTNLFICRL